MNKFNKSKIALLLALTSVFTGNKKSNASMVGNICDIATASSISASLAINNNNKSAAIAAVSLGLIGVIGIPIGAYFWNQKVERDKLADSIIFSLQHHKNGNSLENLKKAFETCKKQFDSKLNGINKINVRFSKLDNNYYETKKRVGNISKILKNKDNLNNIGQQKNVEVIGELAAGAFGEFSKYIQFEGVYDNKYESSLKISLVPLLMSHEEVLERFKDDFKIGVDCLKEDVPVNISIYKNEKGVLSSAVSMNLVTESRYSHSNKHNICFRMSDKFELLIDGHSYDVDEMNKK